jgi:heptaprenyl diphosphate synthase
MCCEGAAIVSRQTENRIAALRDYGTCLGMAFQIADDVLDLAGDSRVLGKPAGSDLRQGTITLPVILLAQQRPDDLWLQHSIRTGENTEAVIEAVRSSGTSDQALRQAEAYAERARQALEAFPDSPARESLLTLTEQVIDRRF